MVFLESRAFSELADEYLGEEGRQELQNRLLENPEAGDVIAGTDGARKIRVGIEGRGKRGGARAIYYYRHVSGAVFFLALYPKNQKADLTAADKKELKERIRHIKEDPYP